MKLKFRAWDNKFNKMVYDFILAPTSPDWSAFPIEQPDDITRKDLRKMEERKGYLFPCGDYTLTDWSNYYGIEYYKVMQFTGVKDKNDKEIYECDIVKCNDYPLSTLELIGEIVFVNQAFKIRTVLGDWSFVNNPEVIGNIYENPELVKGE